MTNYRIMKLRSGETVISQITASTKDTLTFHRPMEMHFPQFIDPLGNVQKGVPHFKNWLAGTNTNDITIPKNHVAAFLDPSREIIFLYEDEKKKEDVPRSQINRNTEPQEEDKTAEDVISKMLGHMFGFEDKRKKTESQNDSVDPNTVSVNIKIPPQLFMHILATGFFQGEEEIPLDDIDFEDGFDNDFEDWSDDPNDYK